MNNWIAWRGPIAVLAVAAMLLVAGIGTLIAAGDLNEASDGQATASALTKAAANLELAWDQALRADALAATGLKQAEAEGLFAEATVLYNASKAVLSSAGVEQIDQAVAGSDQAFAGLGESFAGTVALAGSAGPEAAVENHVTNSLGAYTAVTPAIEGLKTIAGVADSRLQSSLDSGASTLRLLSVFSLLIAAAGLAFAGYSAWTVYQKETEAAEQPAQMQKAA